MPLFSRVLSNFQWDVKLLLCYLVESSAADTGSVQPGTGHEEDAQSGRAGRDFPPPESISTAPHVYQKASK